MTNKVAIVDYGMGNLDSVRRAVQECGGDPIVTEDPRDLGICDRIILPGVGAFGDAMANIRARRLDCGMADEVLGGEAPILGICLGMQLLATTGWEPRETAGLAWIDGEVVQLEPTDVTERIPHIGWNAVEPAQGVSLFDGIAPGSDFYFVHSYHVLCKPDDRAATTPYCGGFASAVEHGNIFGVQFHPEKSQRHGFRLLTNFLRF